jgi:hypothetical protein
VLDFVEFLISAYGQKKIGKIGYALTKKNQNMVLMKLGMIKPVQAIKILKN